MARCPFCKTYYYEEYGHFTCKCGEEIPALVYKYRRERRICGKRDSLPVMTSACGEPFPQMETD